jgi:hypothetical protein
VLSLLASKRSRRPPRPPKPCLVMQVVETAAGALLVDAPIAGAPAAEECDFAPEPPHPETSALTAIANTTLRMVGP